jgi:hypothetical protein
MINFTQWLEAKQVLPCEMCGNAPRISKERYCSGCKKAVLSQLRSTNYLTPQTYAGRYRSPDAKENVRDTKGLNDR